MKKSYGKPLVCYENFTTGEVLTNSVKYAEEVKKKIEKIGKKEMTLIIEETEKNEN